MIIMPVGEFKSHFSEVLKQVEKGNEIVISYGRNRRNIAALLPFAKYKRNRGRGRHIGILQKTARFSIQEPFAMSEKEFMGG